jgi:short-subunit dehydrogenase
MAQQFTGRKLVVIGGSSVIGRQAAADNGSAVIIGHRPDKVEQAVAELSATGAAWGIAADLRDPAELERVQARLASEHADASLLVNAVGVFKPLPFLEHTAADYDSYLELNRAMFFLTQTVARGMVASGRVGTTTDVAAVITFLSLSGPAGSHARSGTSTAASWPDATSN